MKKEIQLIKYEITPITKDWGKDSRVGKYSVYKTEVWDEYGAYSCVYERSEINALEYILEWWRESEDRKVKNDSLSKCLSEMYNNRENGK